MILKDSIEIKTEPLAIFRFFEEMEDNYLRWHPDHLLFEWVSGRGVKEGVVFYFEETIAGQLEKKEVVFTHVVPGQHLEFVPTSRLFRFFLPRILFRIIRQNDTHCLFVAEIHLRIGPLARLQQQELAAVRKHMKEEGENIKRILET